MTNRTRQHRPPHFWLVILHDDPVYFSASLAPPTVIGKLTASHFATITTDVSFFKLSLGLITIMVMYKCEVRQCHENMSICDI